jgi:hypothetical protein
METRTKCMSETYLIIMKVDYHTKCLSETYLNIMQVETHTKCMFATDLNFMKVDYHTKSTKYYFPSKTSLSIDSWNLRHFQKPTYLKMTYRYCFKIGQSDVYRTVHFTKQRLCFCPVCMFLKTLFCGCHPVVPANNLVSHC